MVRLATTVLAVATMAGSVLAADWPTWRQDATRAAVSPEPLAERLHLQWVRQLPPPQPAWPSDQSKLGFDFSYEPIVLGGTLFIGSMVRDSLTAYETRTGAERWRSYADGPIRLAPAAWRDRVFFVSDDGYLHCLEANTGDVLWKFRGGPSDQKVLGNQRLISAWPARGGVVVRDGVVHFAASIWPFMGIFFHALDAHSGKVIWTNSGTGADYILQPHNSPAFAGVAPQGYLAATTDRLIVAGGRSAPAVLDRNSGRLLQFPLADRMVGKSGGGYWVAARPEDFFDAHGMYDVENGTGLVRIDAQVLTDDAIYTIEGSDLVAYSPRPTVSEIAGKDRRGQPTIERKASLTPLWKHRLDLAGARLFLKAGPRLYGAAGPRVTAIDLPSGDQAPRISWDMDVGHEVGSMIAGDARLFVVTCDGRILCFGEERPASAIHHGLDPISPTPPDLTTTRQVRELSRVSGGHCLILGLASSMAVEELAREMYVIQVGSDPRVVDQLRRRFDRSGHYGTHLAVHEGDPLTFSFPPYLANLVVYEDLDSNDFFGDIERFVAQVFRVLRPYGGVACLRISPAQHAKLQASLRTAELHDAELVRKGAFSLLIRAGAIPGSADWTHQYADIGNTGISPDRLVRVPLGLLWFGGPSNAEVLPRHGHGPAPHVVAGRIIIEGPDMLRALDVYTGRLLWQTSLPGLGTFYDETAHQPGANAIGSNYASAADGIYVAYGDRCLCLDPATGKPIGALRFPADPSGARPNWGFVGVWQDYLVAGAAPLGISFDRSGKPLPILQVEPLHNARYGDGSTILAVFNRRTRELLWSHTAEHQFRHNAIVAGRGKLFCIDALSDQKRDLLKRRGVETEGTARLRALDVATGQRVWETTTDVFGTWLGYSEEHDILLEASSRARDRAFDEAEGGLATYRGTDGTVLWRSDLAYGGPCLLHHETIILQGSAIDLLTGRPRLRPHPLTGEAIPWTFSRNYGCNTAIGCENLLTFRSAAAGYFDLATLGGTGNFGGFRSSCTSNLIPANGVLCAPDYTRTCSCAYQNQCSLALAPMADVESWTFNDLQASRAPIRRVGINFGAPGDRVAPNGTLWLEYPGVGGKSPEVPIEIDGDLQWFRQHTSHVDGELAWVASSGVRGATRIRVHLGDPAARPRTCTVRLCFAEPYERSPGERVFDVDIQGSVALADWDIVRAAGAIRRSLVTEHSCVVTDGVLSIGIVPKSSEPSILCGLEIVVEDRP